LCRPTSCQVHVAGTSLRQQQQTSTACNVVHFLHLQTRAATQQAALSNCGRQLCHLQQSILNSSSSSCCCLRRGPRALPRSG
jgi:hypothetical protein